VLLGLVAREIDAETLGLYVLVATTAGYLGLLQLSLDFAAGQRIATALAVSDFPSAARIYRQTAWFNYALIACVVVLMAVGVLLALTAGPGGERGRLLAELVLLVHQSPDHGREVDLCPAVGHRHPAAAGQGFERHEQVRRPVPLVLIVHPLRWPGAAGIGVLTSRINCLDCSSTHTTGRFGLYGRW
jgi:hypothetical protein